MEHPYLRIVAELRRRIAEGELKPGDRVPSTRQLTQDWGVAMATATKALTTLRQEGLVRAVQGVGTVVADAMQTPRRTSDAELSRERIVRVAIEIADSEGLASVSMRRVATELGTATMSLYRHIPGKDELVLMMTDEVFTDEPLPAEPPAGMREQLEYLCRLQWRIFRRHPWLARSLSLTRPQLLRNGLPHTEWSLRALRGLAPKAKLYAYLTLLNFVRGIAVNLEGEAEAERDTGLTPDEWMQTQEPLLGLFLDGGQYPEFAELLRHDIDFELDEVFEFGLQRLLDGLTDLLVPPKR
ncbi:TetR/AcrR family transcriptional regulator C-terminal domain-containing protein [Amycolatopsis sp.]|uniref:TetR/AcrR family transcriptional regulator C-terminal domain-containing protein n=1 Tax=Amycolatopsis sp. TaxID=37632 RepID=UPI002C215D14|nr:TetR/AcrR family transcriptional regulator C-terminal domain-containing protein [Amycolatopsis sp.]HVV12952.1 TetR/AcrR family transcriptional regulator C-terminal domain-containing protein [Amycolatopsis sp.]